MDVLDDDGVRSFAPDEAEQDLQLLRAQIRAKRQQGRLFLFAISPVLVLVAVFIVSYGIWTGLF